MKITELEKIPEGTKLWVSEGNGWYSLMVYHKMYETQSLGKITFSQLMSKDFEPKLSRKQKMAEMIDEKGKTHLVNPRRLSVYQERG